LRFPQILRIDAQPPAEFQDSIRHEFPLLERQSQQFPQLPAEFAQFLGARMGNAHLFLTEDRSATLSLASDAIGLTVNRYTRWEEFRDKFFGPLRSLVRIYAPAFFSRVGLRYSDLIDPQQLGMPTEKWSHLIRPSILGEIAETEFEDNLEALQHIVRFRFPDGSGSVLLQHGLAQAPGIDRAYKIDFDFFNDKKTEVNDAETVLNRFNRRAGDAFRWFITDKLHRALGPTEIPAVSASII